ncbi:DUF397 domain-containing protein [Actinomadura livida]|uniref:DUF397 domain-containing protein n=2 Tax=Actinomadura livida TaxID=79909 RepID=A0ABN1FAA1_9ACTN|nr:MULTISPECIES: DUF397 domain-containing protein [Actinomadura]GGT86204.1 hypothetical protein GCM10010208_06500 [Actinomadura livida]
MSRTTRQAAIWRTSSYSQPAGTDCVEVAGMTGYCAVRDSKNPVGPVLALTRDEWATLLNTIKTGAHDLR